MIVQKIETDYENIIKTYSDSGYKIRQIETGAIYNEAGDAIPCGYTYEEIDEYRDDIYPARSASEEIDGYQDDTYNINTVEDLIMKLKEIYND